MWWNHIILRMGNIIFNQDHSSPHTGERLVLVNAHLHTPYSFSAFDSIPQALDMALEENVRVVGINDFYTTAGYEEWMTECRKRALYPLFNIEFIALDEDLQTHGIRVNDPNNPGRTYLSGKGMAFPMRLDEPYASLLAGVTAESNDQVKAMCRKLNEVLRAHKAKFSLNIDDIERTLTNGLIRERHLAKALRLAVCTHFNNDEKKISAFFHDLFGGKALKSDISDSAGVENEIRGNLLKAGGAAFVPETSSAFLPVETIRQIILNGGGIPTYPFLADNPGGEYTDFEHPLKETMRTLKEKGFWSVEFITTRNGVELLEAYAVELWENGFVVTLGSEHNTPAMEPVELFARHSVPLTDRLKQINFWGAAIIAAHQECIAKGEEGYLNAHGKAKYSLRDQFIAKGSALIESVVSQ